MYRVPTARMWREADISELSVLSDLSEGEMSARRQQEGRTRCIASLPDGAIPDASISRISLTVLMPRWSLPEAMGSGSPG